MGTEELFINNREVKEHPKKTMQATLENSPMMIVPKNRIGDVEATEDDMFKFRRLEA